MSSTDNNTATNGAAAAQPPKKQQPSLYARKLLQKLSTLNPNASLESRQTIASWMVFNRKKCEGMGEGFLLSFDGGASGGEEGPEGTTSAAHLMLLLRILHQVLLSNCPTITTSATSSAEVDTDKWEKSSQLRTNLSEIVMIPLFKALATSLNKLTDENIKDQYSTEIKNMMDDWKEHATGNANSCGGKARNVAVVAVVAAAAVVAYRGRNIVDLLRKESSRDCYHC